LRQQTTEVRDSLFFAYRGFQRAVRTRTFKLIEYEVGGQHTMQFFDMIRDPWERRNLARDPQLANILARFRQRLADWQRELDDPGFSGL
jgi:arylsulfatase A-like enzyme